MMVHLLDKYQRHEKVDQNRLLSSKAEHRRAQLALVTNGGTAPGRYLVAVYFPGDSDPFRVWTTSFTPSASYPDVLRLTKECFEDGMGDPENVEIIEFRPKLAPDQEPKR